MRLRQLRPGRRGLHLRLVTIQIHKPGRWRPPELTSSSDTPMAKATTSCVPIWYEKSLPFTRTSNTHSGYSLYQVVNEAHNEDKEYMRKLVETIARGTTLATFVISGKPSQCAPLHLIPSPPRGDHGRACCYLRLRLRQQDHSVCCRRNYMPPCKI